MARARLTPVRREEMALSVIADRLSKAQAAREYDVSAKIVSRWAECFRAEGREGMQDRSLKEVSWKPWIIRRAVHLDDQDFCHRHSRSSARATRLTVAGEQPRAIDISTTPTPSRRIAARRSRSIHLPTPAGRPLRFGVRRISAAATLTAERLRPSLPQHRLRWRLGRPKAPQCRCDQACFASSVLLSSKNLRHRDDALPQRDLLGLNGRIFSHITSTPKKTDMRDY